MNWRSRRAFLAGSAVAAGGALLSHPLRGQGIAPQDGASNVNPLTAAIDASQVGEPISKYLYGMFLEHAGNLVYRSFWSELLDDRKFYFPVNSQEVKEPATQGFRAPLKKWRPIGPDASVVMDQVHPFVGDQSPTIKLEGANARGIKQEGLWVKRENVYTGRIVLAGTPDSRIHVSLVWGPDPSDRHTIAIPGVHANFATFPLKFTAPKDSTTAGFEISGTGTGSFRVGAVSLMPTDNIHGFRPDTTKLLRQLNSGMYRLPGGNSLSDHDWRDAIGDPDKRPPTYDNAFHAMQPNDVGMDEFMLLCKLLEVDPYVTVNAGFGDARSAAELVEYANGSTSTRMGALRAANGHPEPYHVKYWNIGNEMYGWWQIGHTPLRYYAMKHNAFAKAMRKVDPSIVILASGAMPDEMTVTGNARLTTGKIQSEYGTEGDWTGGLLANCMDHMDAVAEHWYCHDGKRFDLTVSKDNPFPLGSTTIQPTQYGFVPVTEPLIDWARRPANRVRLKADAWAEYTRRFPAMGGKKMFLSIDEWGYGRPRLKVALSLAMAMHEMFRHTEFIKMSAFTFGPSCLDYNPTDAAYNTTGLMFKFYREHFGTLPVTVTGNSPQPEPKWPVGGDQPSVNAGSPTYPLDLVAALTADRKRLTLSVVNCTESSHPLDLNIHGIQVGGKSRLWQLTGPDPDAAEVLGQGPKIEVVELPLAEVPKTLSVAPLSLSIYEFTIA
jgi:alpha-L-arabinofuranosidase